MAPKKNYMFHFFQEDVIYQCLEESKIFKELENHLCTGNGLEGIKIAQVIVNNGKFFTVALKKFLLNFFVTRIGIGNITFLSLLLEICPGFMTDENSCNNYLSAIWAASSSPKITTLTTKSNNSKIAVQVKSFRKGQDPPNYWFLINQVCKALVRKDPQQAMISIRKIVRLGRIQTRRFSDKRALQKIILKSDNPVFGVWEELIMRTTNEMPIKRRILKDLRKANYYFRDGKLTFIELAITFLCNQRSALRWSWELEPCSIRKFGIPPKMLSLSCDQFIPTYSLI